MSKELTMAAQQALACMRGLQQHLGPDICAIEADALERALTQRPAAQSEAQALAHNMMLWREDAVHNGNEYVPVHVRTLEKVIAQLRDMPAPQQATPEPVGERWVVVRETSLDVGDGSDVRTGGRPELGYALISDAATFGSEDEAVAAIKSASLPVGWVVLPLSRLLPDLMDTSPAPGVPELTGEMVNAAHEYLNRFKHWPGLPDQFRWHELWAAMLAAAQAKGGAA